MTSVSSVSVVAGVEPTIDMSMEPTTGMLGDVGGLRWLTGNKLVFGTNAMLNPFS